MTANLSIGQKNLHFNSGENIYIGSIVVPSVTSVLALQQGVVEIAYIGLASSVVGIGLWLSGINQLRTALELGEAIHYTH